MTAIKVENFSYAYDTKNKVLDDINITIKKGSFTAIIGPNGAGKTTLCLAFAGAVPHYFGGSLSGNVIIDGISTYNIAMHDLAQTVGIVLEDYETQLVTMTVEEEIAFSLENAGIPRYEISTRIKEALSKVGLAGHAKHEITSLSGGQKQRLVIASVLATNSKILVLDEPTSALDPEGTAAIYRLLAELNSTYGITIIVVEHEIAKILPYADQFILMDNGKCLQSAPPEKVLAFMADKRVYTEAIPPLWQLKFALETATGVNFSAWRNEQDAINELYQAIQKEVC